jgi:hypothetical protein
MSFEGTLRPCAQCGEKCLVTKEAGAEPIQSPPGRAKLSAQIDETQDHRTDGLGVRTFTNYAFGLWPIRILSFGLIAAGVGLAVVAIVHAAVQWAVATPADVVGALQPLFLAAILVGIGWFIRHMAYIDVWQIDRRQRLVTRLRRRLFHESPEETIPFSCVVSVRLTKTPHADEVYSVDLILDSGEEAFISNNREHAADLAFLLKVPKQERTV